MSSDGHTCDGLGCTACIQDGERQANAKLVRALEVIRETTHHVILDGTGLKHSRTCPPCLAEKALATQEAS